MVQSSSGKKIDRLIREHPPDQTSWSGAADAKTWIVGRLDESAVGNVALAVHARVQAVVEEAEKDVVALEGPRLFYRSDLSHLVKTPNSILDKMTRDWDPRPGIAPQRSFGNFLTEMEDLARFRIVLNFLSDVRNVCSKLHEPYRCKAESRSLLSAAQRALYEDFALGRNRLQDLVRLGPGQRKSGERCFKGIFYPRGQAFPKVEVQIQTMLQEAWDKKDHFLIYEPKRRGESVNEDRTIESYAMSELLYVADLTFDRLKAAAQPRRRRKAKG
jgi:ppGpp synthetase/RelA/SpoT-type nucleotidyltranferase